MEIKVSVSEEVFVAVIVNILIFTGIMLALWAYSWHRSCNKLDDFPSESSRIASFQGASHEVPEGQSCPICLQEVRLAVQTNCGHWFCMPCVMQYWKANSSRVVGEKPVACPCCRRTVTMLIPALRFDEAVSEEGKMNLVHMSGYNRCCSQAPRTASDIVCDAPLLLKRFFSGPQGVCILPIWLTLATAVLYCLSPVDFFPEAFYGPLALVDDAIICFLASLQIAAFYRSALLFSGLGVDDDARRRSEDTSPQHASR
eukprot:TRINITY_DN10789_c2_g1_i1.p1 TRINITY_DN10789_c2_g1~~TRINITY_DN10789_c2_g1_i1.p1  ORF type:complete len:257 (+),score=36.20 TRINITY_DN10789_c2_g1_i1:65-835(+)